MILRDPVHGLVTFERPEEDIIVRLLETREVQRLRRIRQLGLASLAYPGADHTRFSHAIGAAFVMTRLLARLRTIDGTLPFWQRVTTERAREALAAALLHDLGHGPFSHLFEQVLPEGHEHEEWTRRILLDDGTDVHRVLAGLDPELPSRVAELVMGRHELPYLARAVSGTFDVDRCDYLLRDAHATGVGYGRFDLDWLLRSLTFGLPATEGGAPPLAIDGKKGIPAIESFLLARLFMFQQVYFHKTERSCEWMLTKILERARVLIADGTRLPGAPPGLVALSRDGDTTLGEYLALDDPSLWVALSAWQSVKDPLLADLTQRLQARRLFKTYELFGEQAAPRGRLDALDVARDVAKKAGFDPEVHVGLDVASTVALDETDEPLSIVFPDGAVRSLSEVSFLLGRLRGESMARVRLIFLPELRDELKRALRP
ncbi:MAG TPA: HD domain-containing protein [Polyangiaceae bacterium]|nr:HD domain-containing protein [Polyangiaceae bacterium]